MIVNKYYYDENVRGVVSDKDYELAEDNKEYYWTDMSYRFIPVKTNHFVFNEEEDNVGSEEEYEF